ncbi:PREDICTED: ATP-dependent DNA helicase PIF2-like [Nicotiana attenuata]|uniref:ATP-dependent DNA helicase PIF2-like n=1 Tax=Nicotiana attenuata TaxID=49451 RepID=UPI000904CEBF|nr:PREDICTED: ATP-dependent DNA helicase PIF2-like [Nicotiana attenuata]
MVEAESYQMPCSLRRLFATLLVYCDPANPRELWEKFKDSMSEDFKILPDIGTKKVRYKVLDCLNDILHSMGHNINEYKLIPENFKASKVAKEAREIFFERNIIVTEEELLLRQKLNCEQQMAYNVIIDRISSNRAGAFFVDGPGGTGKTFLYRALLATVRSKGFIALATATSGIAASILPGGRTAHSRFKIPIDIHENFSCNISKQSSLACLIRDAKLIVWDEVSMAKKKMIETFGLLLKDLLNTNVLFGGKVVVFGGDFRQTLPVVRNGKREDFIHESLLYSDIWPRLEKLQLSENMRAKTDPAFCEYLMRIGNGKEPLTSENKIEIPNSFIVPYTTEQESLNALFETTFPNMHAFFRDASSVTSRVILMTKNDFVNEINDMLISKFPKEAKTFVAIDETCESNDQSQYEVFLHSLNPAGLPPTD